MLNGEIKPSTIEGLKRLASQIKKQQGIKHAEALDLAARAAKCENFRHALRMLPGGTEQMQKPRLFLTAYWNDHKTYAVGRETLEISLSKPLLSICSKRSFKLVRSLGDMRLVAEDHFVDDSVLSSKDSACRRLCMAARTLRFMEHTGLQPPTTYRPADFLPDGTNRSKLPHADHSTHWFDPVTGQSILIDEPYGSPARDEERSAWSRKYSWHLRRASWPGMYFPGNCDLDVVTDARSGFDIDALIRKIDSIPAPHRADNWKGLSANTHEVFVSPAAKTPQDRRRARAVGTVWRQPSKTTIPFHAEFGGRRRRPAGVMPISDHIEAGRIIKAIIHSDYAGDRLYRRLNSLRSDLEDWLNREMKLDELDEGDFFDVYYHQPADDNPYVAEARSKSGLLRMLDKLKVQLQSAYPDCAPLREQLNKINRSIATIDKVKRPA